jgi:hypothetical protein
MDLEANTTHDLVLDGTTSNTVINCLMAGSSVIKNSANRNTFVGGWCTNFNLDASTFLNTFVACQMNSSLTDSSVAGTENEYINCTAPGGISLVNRIRGGLAVGYFGAGWATPMTPDASQGNIVVFEANAGGAVTINNPTNGQRGQILTYKIRNVSGGALGVITWGANYKMGAAWTQPANAFSRTIQFLYDGTNWIEISRTAVDVTN